MFHGLMMLMMSQATPPKQTLAVGKVENGIIVLRPDPKYRGSMIVVRPDPSFHDPMPGSERKDTPDQELVLQIEKLLREIQHFKQSVQSNPEALQQLETKERRLTELLRQTNW